jgi:ABC transporter substrate binding protein (PQQ-dependent alcohol dehydrogenase system)
MASLLTGSALAEEPSAAPAPAAETPAATPQATEPAAATETPAATPEATEPAPTTETPAAAPPVAEPAPAAETPATTPEATEPVTPAAGDAPAAAPTLGPPMRIVYLGKEYPEPLPLSYAEKPITDKGIQGARLSIKEANQAGNFVGHSFEFEEVILPEDGDVVAAAKEILKDGPTFIIADLQTADLIAVADLPEAKDSIIMNIRSSATALRQELCRVNVFHIIPDYAMRADALAQYMIWKKWPRWFVLRRDSLADRDYLAQVKRAAARFGGKVVEDRIYALPPGARNLDSGHQQVQAQIPMETETAPDHDVVWVINSEDDFGDYLAYRTALPRPIVGTQGLQAVAWDPSYTESGGMHFQNAIPRIAKRKPVERDYTAWLAIRSIADSAMKSGKTTPQEVKEYLLSDQFKLEGFKGQAMSFRTWDHQMRQPIILGGGTRVPVSTSPQEGFLHEINLTDTLGFDKPESKCKFPTEGNTK